MANILVLHGPNLNRLGSRQTDHYGKQTLATINHSLAETAKQLGHQLTCLQSQAEHELIDHIHNAQETNVEFIIFNPAAFTHTSIALRDALLAVKIPFIEVHLSNVFQRETFRQKSYFSDIAFGIITGLGPQGYELALYAANKHLAATRQSNTMELT